MKKNLKIDKITRNTFNEIFKDGISNLSDEEKAKKIYYYIANNINYSSQDFRQSGYVPQKPSKTITTKLGDCKDVSTLFVALSQLAEIKANLVLVSTNDNGFTSMALPSNEFNHCIVKVILDKKDYFIELTDKYLPFKALPVNLYKANALVISFDKTENENSKIINIPFDNVPKNISKSNTILNIDDKGKNFINTFEIQGSGKAYYNELFSSGIAEDIRKKRFEEEYNQILKKVVTLQSSKIIKNNAEDDYISFETQFSIPERLQSVGSLKISNIPFIQNIYTRDIITLEQRKYDIEYYKYENVNEYHSTTTINIPEGKIITEIPESKNFTFKNHSYTLKFEKTSPTTIVVSRSATVSWEKIKPEDYANFKKYVEDVITTEEQIIGFK